MKSPPAVRRAAAARAISNPLWILAIAMACFFAVAASVMALG